MKTGEDHLSVDHIYSNKFGIYRGLHHYGSAVYIRMNTVPLCLYHLFTYYIHRRGTNED